MQKIVYDKKTGNEVILDKSDLCPISGRWLIPSRCTETPPPEKKDGCMVGFVDGAWRQFEILDEDEKEEANSFQKGSSASKSAREEIEDLKSKVDFLEKEMTERESEIAFLRSEFLKSEIRSLVVEEIEKR